MKIDSRSLLRNIMYNDVLGLPVPTDVTILSFGDEIAIVIAAKHVNQVETMANETVTRVKAWRDTAG